MPRVHAAPLAYDWPAFHAAVFPTDPALSTYVMKRVIEQGGLAPGGLNFDAKVTSPRPRPTPAKAQSRRRA
eukprot:5626097-Prymnesium_polylepis.1